jgi:hypothetical protein
VEEEIETEIESEKEDSASDESDDAAFTEFENEVSLTELVEYYKEIINKVRKIVKLIGKSPVKKEIYPPKIL